MIIRAAIYARTSPDCPLSAEDQVEHLKSIAVERGWTVASVFTDRPTTVRKGLDRRAGEVALLDAIRSGGVEKVLIFGIDRVGRSLADLVSFMEACRTACVSLWLDEQGLDTAGSNGLPIFDVVAMMAHHLRQSRRDRILRGQSAARSLSIRFGRPPIVKAKVEKARIALTDGKGVRQAARLAGISAASASRLKTALGTLSAAG
jgi:DNA invertase Pin-like site-specific DNA recombinase